MQKNFWGVSLAEEGGLLGRGGGSLWQGGLPACTEADPPVDRQTPVKHNLRKLRLRAVINAHHRFLS